MGKKSSAPPPPDYSGLIAANQKSADMANKLAQQQFDWAKKVYNDNKGLVDQVNTSFLKTMEDARVASEEDRARYKTLYQPMEDKLLTDANSYDTPERRDQEVGAAQSGVAQQFQAARDSATRQLEGFGVNPSATRFAALDVGLRANEAAAKAAAGTGAAHNVEDQARALRTQAIDIGRGYPAQVNASAATAGAAGAGAVNNDNTSYATGASAMGTGPQWASAGNAAMANWGNILNQQYGNQMAQYNANQQSSSGVGSIIGLVGGMAGKYFGLAEGGVVPPEASPSRGAVTDDVPATAVGVNVGEFVIPKEAVAWKGEEFFHKVIGKARQERTDAMAVPAGVMHTPESIHSPGAVQ